MKKKFILGNCYLNNLKQFWHIWPQCPWPLTQWPKSIGFLCCPGRMCGQSLWKVGLKQWTYRFLFHWSISINHCKAYHKNISSFLGKLRKIHANENKWVLQYHTKTISPSEKNVQGSDNVICMCFFVQPLLYPSSTTW